MKIYTKIILDKNNLLIKEEYFEYNGPVATAGIHYDFKSTKSSKSSSSLKKGMIDIDYNDLCTNAITLAFDKRRSDDRKDWLLNYDKNRGNYGGKQKHLGPGPKSTFHGVWGGRG
mgnify:CR=1 FL=1